jgi:hypothetical protein
MSRIHCFTSATFTYLDRARVLCETLRHFHPDWTLWLCLADEEPPGFDFDPSGEQFDHVVRLNELKIPDRAQWIFDHDVVELCTAVKGQMLCKLLDEGAEKVVYLDPDIALLNDLSPIALLLDRWNVVLTPHQLEPDLEPSAILDNEIGSLKHGIYNLGFLAVAGTVEGRRFAQWWRDRLQTFCFDDVPKGLFTDQRWCDHVPVFFDGVHILRDAGCNVASWNLSRRPITIEEDGTIRAAGQRLRFFHFTKVTHVGEIMLERYAGDRIEVFELIKWYRSRLAGHFVPGLPEAWWAYSHYANGTRIAKEHRLMYRSNVDLRRRYPNPFVAGPRIFSR